MLLALLGFSLAAAPGYYLPADVAAASKLFNDTSTKMAPRFETAQDQVSKVSGALGDLDVGVSMLGTKAPAGMPEWAATTRRTLTGQYLRLARLLSKMQDDYSGVFSSAMERVLPTATAGYAAKECGNTGVMAQFHHNSCEGENLNPRLAAAMDQDAELQKALAEIQAVEWPTIDIAPQSWAVVPLTGAARYVQLAPLAHALFQAHLDARQAQLEEAAAPLEDALAAKDPAAIQQAGKLKDQWRANLGTDGMAWMPVLTEALGRLEKKKGGPAEVGLCANPANLGGCPGEDVTAQVIGLLQADKKFLAGTERI